MRDAYVRKPADNKYPAILADLQRTQLETFWKITAEANFNAQNKKTLIMPQIRHQVEENKYSIAHYTTEELCERLYNDTQAYSILTGPLEDPFVEGIHVNAWNNVRLQFTNGQSCKIDGFLSPQHAIDVIRKLLQESNQVLDDAVPVAEGSLNANVRITAVKTPIVDDDVGIACYIRKLAKRVFREQDYLTGDFANRKEIRMLQTALRRGASILLVGKVNTGKTTFLSYLLSTLPDDYEIITIEGGAREMNLVKTDSEGNATNNVLHMITHESKDVAQNISQEILVEKSLRLNPIIISPAEMRNLEAYAAVEASLSGHIVISTTHAGSPQQAHKRIANLCRKKYTTDYQTALEQACEAFPLVVFLHTLEDNRRRIMAISECYVDNGTITYRPLWRYEISENYRDESGALHIKGSHTQINEFSSYMVERMKMYGVSQAELAELTLTTNSNTAQEGGF